MTKSDSKSKLANLLRKTRQQKKLTRLKVAKQLKVPIDTIRSLENVDDASLSPSHRQGLSRRYAEILDLDDPQTKLLLSSIGEGPLEFKKPSSLNSKRIVVVSRISGLMIGGLIIAVIIGYSVWQIRGLGAAPSLQIDQPLNYTRVNSAELTISGRSNAEASVLVNGEPVPLSLDGEFVTTVYLLEGYNSIEITAINSFSRETTQNRQIFYRPLD